MSQIIQICKYTIFVLVVSSGVKTVTAGSNHILVVKEDVSVCMFVTQNFSLKNKLKQFLDERTRWSTQTYYQIGLASTHIHSNNVTTSKYIHVNVNFSSIFIKTPSEHITITPANVHFEWYRIIDVLTN